MENFVTSVTYSGNQLQKVADAVEDPTWQGAFNFMDGAGQQTEYEYDENGNLTKDLNKKISRITYNFLNLPKEIMFMDGSYIHYTYDAEDLTQFFTDINITEENGIPYLNVMYKGKKPICERILKLDAERYQKGDLPLSNLLSKYCSYIVEGNRE